MGPIPCYGKLDIDQYIDYDPTASARDRYAYRPTPTDPLQSCGGATNLRDARSFMYSIVNKQIPQKQIPQTTHTVKPFGERIEVDPYIGFVSTAKTWSVITPTGYIKPDFKDLDGARKYAYAVYVKNDGKPLKEYKQLLMQHTHA